MCAPRPIAMSWRCRARTNCWAAFSAWFGTVASEPKLTQPSFTLSAESGGQSRKESFFQTGPRRIESKALSSP